MTFELSLQIKILALVGLLLAAGAAGTLVLAHNRSASHPVLTAVTRPAHAQATTHRPATVAHAASAPLLDPSLPTPLRQALARSRMVVAVVYAPGDPADAEVLAQARQGAASAHVGFAALNIRDDKIAGATAAWMKNVFEPAVIVVTRTGQISAELDGYADSTMIAQAVLDARQ